MHNLERTEELLNKALGKTREIEINPPPLYSVPDKLPPSTPEELARLMAVRQALDKADNQGGEGDNNEVPERVSVSFQRPLDQKPFSRGQRLLKKVLALGSMFGFGLGAFQGETKADNVPVDTNVVNSATAPIYVGGDKNWGPGTNKVDWAKAPGGKADFGQKNSGGKIEDRNEGQQKVSASSGGMRVAGGTVSPGRTYTANGFSSGRIVVGGDVNVGGSGAFGALGVEGRYVPGPSGVEVHDYNVSGRGNVDYLRITKTPGSVSRHPLQADRQEQAKKDLKRMFGGGKK